MGRREEEIVRLRTEGEGVRAEIGRVQGQQGVGQ